MRFLLEISRIIFIFVFIGGVVGALLSGIFKGLGYNLTSMEGAWLIWVAVFLLVFILYRNKLQFTGWYKGKGGKKLSKLVTISLLGFSLVLLIIAPFLG